jgi:midasin
MKLGHWLLLDGANLCNPSVLDRLNPLCEPHGYLTLSERGYVDGQIQTLKPHPNFRLFMTVDPQYGELSRAMRNRGIEIALLAKPKGDDIYILSDFQRLPRMLPKSTIPCVAFDAMRRGLLIQAEDKQPLVSSTGRSLDQESGLSTLVDQAPMVVASSSSMDVVDAHLFFLARTVAPAYLQYCNRFLASLSPTYSPSFYRFHTLLETLARRPVIIALSRFREVYSLSHGLPLSIVFTQVS